MKQGFVNLTGTAVACLILVLPGALSARERRGANLDVTLKDGHHVAGELVAIKPDSLLLLDLTTGHDASVALDEVSVIRIARKSKALTGLLVGFVPGAVGGAVLGAHASDGDMTELGALFGGLVIGSVAGLVGLAAGLGLGLDAEIDFASLPEAEKSGVLAKLNRLAREPGVYVPKPTGPAAGLEAAAPTPAALDLARFRLSWMPGYFVSARRSFYEEGVVPFRFTEALPPGEAGPYPSTYYWATPTRQILSLGRIVLGYQWTQRLGAEIEFFATRYTINHLADLQFTSTVDDLAYIGMYGGDEITRSTSLLIGLSYRPLAPTILQPHAVEAAVAAGPAWISTSIPPSLAFSRDSQAVDRKTTWTARARISYDYHFSRTLSMGVYAEYRRLQVDIPAFGAMENMEFREVNNYSGNYFWRLTEITLPAQRVNMGGVACGLKFAFGF
jgi:hypothetical protein